MFDLGSKILIFDNGCAHIVRYPSPCEDSIELKDVLMNETIINFDKTFAVCIKLIALIFTFHHGFEPFFGCLLRLCFILASLACLYRVRLDFCHPFTNSWDKVYLLPLGEPCCSFFGLRNWCKPLFVHWANDVYSLHLQCLGDPSSHIVLWVVHTKAP